MNTEPKTYMLNGEMIWSGELSKVKGEIVEKPVHFYIRPLNEKDAAAMGDFSKTIYENLRSGEECFIHKHSKEYYFDVFQNPKLHYFGAFIGDMLIGMSYLKVCENNKELQEELPNSCYNFFNKGRNEGKNLIASFGGDSVHPDFRGNSLNIMMINYRIEQAHRLGCTDCTSIVDRNNRWNMSPYFICRFNLFETAIDPSDGGKISLLHKPIQKETVLSCFKTRVSLPYDRLELIDHIIQKGFIGVDFDKENAKVVFAHSSYYRPNSKNRNQFLKISDVKQHGII